MPVRLGVVGLGRGFMLMIPTFTADPRVKLVAAAAPRAESRAAFEAEFGGRTYDDIVPLCADPEVEAVYIAGPERGMLFVQLFQLVENECGMLFV